MPTAPLFDGPVVARRAPARRAPLASGEPAPTRHAPRLPPGAGSWQEVADTLLGEIAELVEQRARRARRISLADEDEDEEARRWLVLGDEIDRRRLIATARRAAGALVEAGWDADEATRHALETAALVLAPAEIAPPPAPRSLLGEIAELPGRTRPARVGRDSALDNRPAEAWRPASIRPAPPVERAPALTPRQVADLRKKERASLAPTPARLARAARRALREEELAEQARRDRDQRRRVAGK
jgi:hypothetical protein